MEADVALGRVSLEVGRDVDPELAARAIIAVGDSDHPPLHIPLGRDAVARLGNKIATATRDLEAWRDVVYSTGG